MKRLINAIVIHCSASPNGSKHTVADIDAMHKVRGFKRDTQAARNFNPELKHVGYHFVITTDGVVHTARGIEEIGAHVQGSNAKSIGVCMIGTDKFTEAQWEALHNCIIGLTSRISGVQVMSPTHCTTLLRDMEISLKGHRDYSPDLNGDGIITRNEWLKICPGFSVKDWIHGGMIEVSGHIL